MHVLYDRVTEPRDILWMDTRSHIALYGVPDYVEPAARAAQRLVEHLAVAGA